MEGACPGCLLCPYTLAGPLWAIYLRGLQMCGPTKTTQITGRNNRMSRFHMSVTQNTDAQ